jgi:Domain of unknown function (DUF3463)
MPTYNVFGWQRPCYLLTDEGYAPTFKSLMEDTVWENYGVGRNPACDNCMAHCGFEGTAVDDAFMHPLKLLKATLRGPQLNGPMVPEHPILYSSDRPRKTVATVAVSDIKRSSREPDAPSSL